MYWYPASQSAELLNFGARVISGRRKYDYISDVLKDLRWLDAHNLIRYHRLCLVHSVDTTGRPESIADTLGDAAQHQYMTRAAGNHATAEDKDRRQDAGDYVTVLFRTMMVYQSMSMRVSSGRSLGNISWEISMVRTSERVWVRCASCWALLM